MRIVLASLLVLLATSALADEIKLRGGRSIPDVEVTDETYEKVSYKIHSSPQEEPSSNVVEVVYTRMPIGFAEAKKAFERGEYSRVAGDWDALRKAKEQWARQYAAFYFAECKRYMNDTAGAAAAYEALLKEFPKSRFYPQAKLGLGNIRLDQKDYSGAQRIFEELSAEAKSKKLGDEVASEASFKLAATLEAQGNSKDAIDRYERVASTGTGGHAANMARIAASRLKAQQDASKADLAVATLRDIIESQDPERLKASQQPDFEALAAAWNAIGEAHAAKGEHAKAVLDFCRVALTPDLSKVASERPHALYGAAVAFEKARGQDWKERSDQMKRELKDQYPTSVWAKKLGGG